MTDRKFGIIIISHGRADKVYTVKCLQDCGYTGDYVILLDDEDTSRDEYIKQYGKEHIRIFSKTEMEKKVDAFDYFPNRSITIFVRNACWEVARNEGWTHFLELDDDYTNFTIRRQVGDELRAINLKNLDEVCEDFCDYLDSTNALTIAFAQGGDFIGGINSQIWKKKLKRKAMNAFFCRVDRQFDFIGRMNDDVNAYITYGMRGDLMLTVCDVCVIQPATQTNSGGMTEAYLNNGTYQKSFYSVICEPSCARIGVMGTSHPRIHHEIDWAHCTPMIINECYKKK